MGALSGEDVTSEVSFLEKYVKAVLYAYPVLLTVEKEYGQHIENMAILSYRSNKDAETLMENIVEEIIVKDKLLRLKGILESVLKELSVTERAVVGVRYFGVEGKAERLASLERYTGARVWSESRYSRMQARLLRRIAERLALKGLSKAVFEREYAEMELFEKIFRYMSKRKEGVSAREKRWLQLS